MSYSTRPQQGREAMTDRMRQFEDAIWQLRSQSPSFKDEDDPDEVQEMIDGDSQWPFKLECPPYPSSPSEQPGRRLQQWHNERRNQYEPHDGWWPEPFTDPLKEEKAVRVVPDDYPPGNATLTYPGRNGETVSINKLNISLIEARSPLLAAAFEPYRFGECLNLDTLSETTAMPLLRYLYSGSYAEADFWEDVPTSLLLHCQMLQLGCIYDLEELKSQAYVNILRQCEFGCSSGDKPIDLCSAIRFTYNHLRANPQVSDSIVHYCVTSFLTHRLGEDAEFKQLAYDLRPFHQDLVKTCRSRGFDDESAMAIIRLPYKPYLPATYASTEHPAIARFEDLIYHYHGDEDGDDQESSPSKRQRLSDKGKSAVRSTEVQTDISVGRPMAPGSLSLAFRPIAKQVTISAPKSSLTGPGPRTLAIRQHANPVNDPRDDSSASEDEGFHLVRKRPASTASASSTQPLLVATDSDYEVLSGPEAVASASSGCESDSESDTATLVDVPRAEVSMLETLTAERSGDGSSDSEWEQL